MKVYPDKTGALCAGGHAGSYTGQDAMNDMLPVILNSSGGVSRPRWTPATIKEQEQETAMSENTSQSSRRYVLRRLTPMECMRLQGYPDSWLDGVQGSDSAIYKAAGNSLAIPCTVDVIGRIARFVANEDKISRGQAAQDK